MPVMAIMLLLHIFPPSYPHCLWITRFLATTFTSFDVSTAVIDKFFHIFYKRYLSIKLSTNIVDNFSTLSTKMPPKLSSSFDNG